MFFKKKTKSGEESESVFRVYRSLWSRFLVHYKWTLFFSVLCGGIAAVTAGFGLPVIIEKVFPIIFGEKPFPDFVLRWVDYFAIEDVKNASMWVVAALMPLLMIFRGVFAYINIYLINKVGLRVLEKVRLQLFSRLQELPLAYHDKLGRGELLSRTIYYTQTVQSGCVNITNDLVIQPLTFLGALGFLAYQALTNAEVSMLLINIFIAAICVPIVRLVGKRILNRMKSMLIGLGEITTVVQQNLSAQRDIRAFCLEEQQIGLLKDKIRIFINAVFKLTAWNQTLTPALEIISVFALSFSLFMAVRTGLSLTQFTAIALALYYCYDPIKKLGVIHNTLTMTAVALKMIDSIIYAKDELKDPEKPIEPDVIRGNISFESVDFSYDAGAPVLQNVNVSVPAGQVVALVGPSGSGKTTFINLVCRFYDVKSGAIKIDGIDVRSFSKKTRMGAIALVSQSPILFRGSIRENILIGKETASESEFSNATRSAFVDEFVFNRADGFDRQIGEGGDGLSGGQKQRVAIARVFLKNAPILILDEATSSLDMLSEEKIQVSLTHLMRDHTTFIIAHRFSTIRNADRILVFESGKIVGDGTHDYLYKESALYKHLYDEQVAEENKKGEDK